MSTFVVSAIGASIALIGCALSILAGYVIGIAKAEIEAGDLAREKAKGMAFWLATGPIVVIVGLILVASQ